MVELGLASHDGVLQLHYSTY